MQGAGLRRTLTDFCDFRIGWEEIGYLLLFTGFIALHSCDYESAMKILLGIIVLVVVLASVIADYKWRQWMAARRRERQ